MGQKPKRVIPGKILQSCRDWKLNHRVPSVEPGSKGLSKTPLHQPPYSHYDPPALVFIPDSIGTRWLRIMYNRYPERLLIHRPGNTPQLSLVSVSTHWWGEAIVIKYLAQGHNCCRWETRIRTHTHQNTKLESKHIIDHSATTPHKSDCWANE